MSGRLDRIQFVNLLYTLEGIAAMIENQDPRYKLHCEVKNEELSFSYSENKLGEIGILNEGPSAPKQQV